MKKLVIASGVCMVLSGCIGFSWTSKVDDGAVYELNRKMYITEEDGILDLIPMLPCTGKSSKATSKGALSTLGNIVSAVPNMDMGICVRLIALSVISSALRLRNMIKRIF